jgi:deaminated glutathione amidase
MIKLAAVQMVSTPDVKRNLEAAWRLLEQAAAEGAQLAALPEYFCLMGRRDLDKLEIAEVPGEGPIQDLLARAAQRFKMWIVGGTLPLKVAGRVNRLHNSCLVFNPDGERVARYDKIHLFAFDNGVERYDESALLDAGQQPTTFVLRTGDVTLRVGLSVCYDLRFPELYRRLSTVDARGPCDLICVPSAFTYTTGQAHWELLLRARAVENQCYVLAPAQGGVHENGRQTWGHSLLVDPWGVVTAEHVSGEGIAVGHWQSQRLDQVRLQLPSLRHRVLD